MKKARDLIIILDLHRQGLTAVVAARRVGIDSEIDRKYIARRLDVPTYDARQLRDRLPDL